MRIAIWTVTRGAGTVGKEIREKLGGDLYTLKKFNISETIEMDDFTKCLEDNFHFYDGHIFVMATGIVIRKIAGLIKSKDIDPAIVVIDEKLNFAISLLSGHLGGANELANLASEKLGVIPIITTSSDVTGKIAVDTLAQRLRGELESLETAKYVTSLIVDGKKVLLKFPNNLVEKNRGNIEGEILVSNREKIEITRIYPKNLIVGIGARRGIDRNIVVEAIRTSFEKHNLSLKSIKKFATVDLKADEEGILNGIKEFGFHEIEIISRDKILEIEEQFEGSEFVKKEIGVSAVSEPCAFLASTGDGKFIEKKFRYTGVTVSIYEEKIGYEIW